MTITEQELEQAARQAAQAAEQAEANLVAARQQAQAERMRRSRELATRDLAGFDPEAMRAAAQVREQAFRDAASQGEGTVKAYVDFRAGRLLDHARAAGVRAACDLLGRPYPPGHDAFSVLFDELPDYSAMIDRVLRDEAAALLEQARTARAARAAAYIEGGNSK